MTIVSTVGSEILVNTATANTQGFQKIVTLSNGNVVVVWNDISLGNGGATGDSSGGAVKAQVFSSHGDRIGSEILVNTATSNNQFISEITALSNGGFVVTWGDESHGIGGATGDSSGFAVKAQVFTAAGAKTGPEILVNTATADHQVGAQITSLANGAFVVTWEDHSQGVGGNTGDSSVWAVKAQLFTATGAKTGSEILVNTATAGAQGGPEVTTLADGRFVVTWHDVEQANHKAQLFTSTGVKIGSEILVSTFAGGIPTVTALSNGGFVVTWNRNIEEIDPDTTDYEVQAQLFTATGAVVGSEMSVNTTTIGDQYGEQVTALSNGAFVVTWLSTDSVGTTDIRAQLFAVTGDKIGSEFLVNTTEANGAEVNITSLSNGRFVVTWQSAFASDPSGSDVKAQVFTAAGVKIGSEILVNTATVNNQFSPEITALPNGGFMVTWNDGSHGIGGATGDTSSFAVKAQVFSVIDPDNLTPPTITTADQQDVSENTTLVAPLTSTDSDTGGTNPAIFTITGGADAALFEIVDGNLAFKAAKDFETDALSYQVEVTASDGANTSSQMMTITLTDATGVTINGTAAAETIDATQTPAGQPTSTPEGDIIAARGGDDTIHGLDGDDTINGGAGDDTIYGDGGNDVLNGSLGADEMHGGTGDDIYLVDVAGDTVIEGADQGTDFVSSFATYTLGDNVENLLLKGIGDIGGTGNGLNNKLTGNAGDNTLSGAAGDDTLSGGAGEDTVTGGAGRDIMFGGADGDIFVFEAVSDSPVGGLRDVIKDFVAGADTIDLAAIDANTGIANDQGFTFIGSGAFTRTAGELQAVVAGANTLISGDTDGNGRADFQVLLAGHVTLQATDFVL